MINIQSSHYRPSLILVTLNPSRNKNTQKNLILGRFYRQIHPNKDYPSGKKKSNMHANAKLNDFLIWKTRTKKPVQTKKKHLRNSKKK